MSQSDKPIATNIDRRGFLKTGMAAAIGSAAVGSAAIADDASSNTPQIPSRTFGKTGVKLPILGFGGAALPKHWGNPLSTEDRVKLVRYAVDQGVRYFDTAGNYMESETILGEGLQGIRDKVFLVTKVETTDPAKVRGAVESSLKKLRTDRLDAVLIHGTPGLEQMNHQQAMKIHAELAKLRDQGVTRFIGFSAHSYFDKALALINTGGFDLCMLSHGFFLRGYNQVFSNRMLKLREACIAAAHQRGMGIVAMKVVGAGVLGAWSKYIVPGFDGKRLQRLPAAAIRFALGDERVHMLNVGMRLRRDIDANIETLSGNVKCTPDDRALLAEYMAKARQSDAIKKMKVD